ncbi:hypothetical protein QE411_002933 [Microbacterium arborescens]|nr:hypothetical protein [Microbacterium arborescens]
MRSDIAPASGWTTRVSSDDAVSTTASTASLFAASARAI